MTTGFEVSVPEIKSSAQQPEQVADQFTEQISQFEAEVSGQGEPWGGDDIGMLIGIAHSAVFEAAMECFRENAKELSERAEALRAMAENYERMEEANTESVNMIAKALG